MLGLGLVARVWGAPPKGQGIGWLRVYPSRGYTDPLMKFECSFLCRYSGTPCVPRAMYSKEGDP